VKEIGAFEARTHFSALLKRVARGETIVITRRGAPVARLVPIAAASSRARREQAIARIKALAKRHTLGGLRLKALRDEGRK
jgi:prevent-host-death family protein